MPQKQPPLFSVITPSRGNRPLALAQAIASVDAAAAYAIAELPPAGVEMLVGFDGVKGQRTSPDGHPAPDYVRFFDLPHDGNFGNAIRDTLLRAARGRFVLFVDDDNALTPEAFSLYLQGLEYEMQVGRIDVSRAFDKPFLPEDAPGRELVRQGNIDPLCLCLSRELITIRCGGWQGEGGYESDYLNILRYARRARSIRRIDQLVGIYDAGCGLDDTGFNSRQLKQTDRKTT
ncbi:glycosyl transferase family 2 [Desulfovibrio ferrophilus]|uniref:Glycosyl transferase, group 2 family protein n=1 Tax=Desulfovibrio ferrophilus TaxID=241368 RepID=A0A2Z6B0U4_9BACT|nr:glycosyl transferase family 2 [Desulfovibrio ferrophilus]BBD09131.1 glycosyl transferase, group 2 family protein [Desulfovibrio ferrophilus]